MRERESSPGFPKELCCPISEELYNDPVLLVESGQTYSRESIAKWFKKGHKTCPLTGKELNSTQLVPNYVVKGLVQSWLEGHPANGTLESHHVKADRGDQAKYPIVFDGEPQDRISQAADMLRHIRSPSMEVPAYRNGCSYQIWQLHSLARDRTCWEYLLREGAVKTVAVLLADQHLAETSACLLRCLATPESSKELLEAGGVERLVGLLGASSGRTREAAALTLYHMSVASPAFCTEVFTGICKVMLAKRGDALVLAALEPLYNSEPAEGAAATYLLNVLTAGPGQQWPDYFLTAGTSALPCLVQQLTADGSAAAAVYAASCALTSLMATPVNQPFVVQELVGAMQKGSPSGKQQAAVLLWQLLTVPATATVNPAVAGLCMCCEGLMPGLSWALHAASWAAAGLMQALTHDGRRVTNSVTKGPDSDAMRLRIAAPEANVIPQLINLMSSDDAQCRAAGAHALANMTAYRSGSCEACSKGHWGAGVGALAQHRTQAACPHQPTGRVLASAAPGQLLRLLCASSDPAAVSACVAAVSNLCATEDGQQRIHDEAKRAAPGLEGVKARLLQCISWKSLSVRFQDAARNVLVRLESKNRKGPPISLMTLLLLPPTPVAALPDP